MLPMDQGFDQGFNRAELTQRLLEGKSDDAYTEEVKKPNFPLQRHFTALGGQNLDKEVTAKSANGKEGVEVIFMEGTQQVSSRARNKFQVL